MLVVNPPLLFALLTALALLLLLVDGRRPPQLPSLLEWVREREQGRRPAAARAEPDALGLLLGPLVEAIARPVGRLALALGLRDRHGPEGAPTLGGLTSRLALGARWAAIFVVINVVTALVGALGGRVPFSLPWAVPVVAFAAGFIAAGLQRGRQAEQHREAVAAGLPGLLDLLVLTLAAGEGLEEGLRRGAERPTPLADELRAVLRAYNTRGESFVRGLDRLGQRLELAELHALATTIDLAERQGTHLLEPLTRLREDIYATELRQLKRQAERKTWAMLFPVALLTLPATLFMVIIPAGAQLLAFIGRR